MIDIRAASEVARDILEAAKEYGADSIVIGSREQNMIRGLFLGSVAREVLRLSNLPVRLEWIEATGKDGEAACERTCYAGLAGASGDRLFASGARGRSCGGFLSRKAPELSSSGDDPVCAHERTAASPRNQPSLALPIEFEIALSPPSQRANRTAASAWIAVES